MDRDELRREREASLRRQRARERQHEKAHRAQRKRMGGEIGILSRKLKDKLFEDLYEPPRTEDREL